MPLTREFLKKIGIEDETLLDQIMGENGKDIEASKNALAELASLKAERDGLSVQIKERDKDIKALREQTGNSEEISKKLTELQSKYDTDTANLQKQLGDQAYDHAAEKYFESFKFSSTAAKKAAMADFKAKGLKLVDGKFEGASEFIDALKKEDPAAFVPEPEPDKGGAGGGNGGPQQNPMFTKGMNQNPPAGNPNPFDFGFSGVRTTKQK